MNGGYGGVKGAATIARDYVDLNMEVHCVLRTASKKTSMI